MERYIIDGTKLRLLETGKELSFDFIIKTVLTIENVFVVLLDIPHLVKYNRNVFAFNEKGEILWQVDELPFYPG